MPDLTNPEHRKAFIDDQLKRRGKFVPVKDPTPEQRICTDAMRIFNQVTTNTLRPLLRALTTPSQYNSVGTLVILKDAFQSRFNTFSKDELVTLLSIMHAEELEKQAKQMAAAGNIGEFLDKPI